MLNESQDRGTVLLMFPAAMLIVLVLGGMAIDVSLSQVRARELQSVAASSANDALASLDIAALRNDGEIRFDHARAQAIVAESVAAGPLPSATIDFVGIQADALGRPEFVVTLSLEVDLVIAPALPGNLETTRITRTETVTILG